MNMLTEEWFEYESCPATRLKSRDVYRADNNGIIWDGCWVFLESPRIQVCAATKPFGSVNFLRLAFQCQLGLGWCLPSYPTLVSCISGRPNTFLCFLLFLPLFASPREKPTEGLATKRLDSNARHLSGQKKICSCSTYERTPRIRGVQTYSKQTVCKCVLVKWSYHDG